MQDFFFFYQWEPLDRTKAHVPRRAQRQRETADPRRCERNEAGFIKSPKSSRQRLAAFSVQVKREKRVFVELMRKQERGVGVGGRRGIVHAKHIQRK